MIEFIRCSGNADLNEMVAANSLVQMQQDDIKREEKLKNIGEMVKKWDFY
jgi:hypothetical protein